MQSVPMSVASETYREFSPRPAWRGKFPATSGGVKLSLITDQRSEPPPFWQPRKDETPASAVAAVPAAYPTTTITSPASGQRSDPPSFWQPRPVDTPSVPLAAAVTSPASFPPVTSPRVSPASPTTTSTALESVRRALKVKEQRHVAAADGEKDAKPYRGRKDAQSTGSPGTTTPASHHQRSPSSTHALPRASPNANASAPFTPQHQPRDVGSLDARAEAFVPGRAALLPSMEEVDLNAYIRAGAGVDLAEKTSSQVSVCGSRRSSRSSMGEGRSTETDRDREEAERQWHLQATWDGDEGQGGSDEWGSTGATGLAQGEVREEGANEVKEEAVKDEPLPAPSSDESAPPQPSRLRSSSLSSSPSRRTIAAQTSSSSSLSSFGLLLERAKMIDDRVRVEYPEGIKLPDAQAVVGAKTQRFCYDREFLLQFEKVCTGRPATVPFIPPLWRAILAPSEYRPARVRTASVGVQTSPPDDRDDPLKAKGEEGERCARKGTTANPVLEPPTANQPSINGDAATARMADVMYHRLVDDGSTSASAEVDGSTCRATACRDGDRDAFHYEMEEARRERLEARVEYLTAEVKLLKLELARVLKVVGMS